MNEWIRIHSYTLNIKYAKVKKVKERNVERASVGKF